MSEHIGDFESGSGARYVKKYLVIFALLVSIIIGSIFFAFSLSASNLIREQMRSQAISLFNGVKVMRMWVASHGGVYTPITEKNGVNPYLADLPGVKAMITDTEGRTYALKNPATVTRELSEIGMKMQLMHFKITSLNTINPRNAPDQFEAEVMQRFQEKPEDYGDFAELNGKMYYRHMSPLIVQQTCLPCHAQHGYKLGDLRGALSIAISADKVLSKIMHYNIYSFLTAFAVFLMICALIYYISQFFIRDLRHAEERLMMVAITDSLTELYNRGFGLSRLEKEMARSRRGFGSLAVCMFDIDHFKQVNDMYGHLAGDAVLKMFSRMLEESVREYDIICRYGGEEFLVILPGAELEDAHHIAERIRERVASTPVQDGDQSVQVTVSVGIAMYNEEETLDALVGRADKQLYAAKEEGRNRVKIDK